MTDHILDLSEQIVVGLTSSLSRSVRESVRTTIFVRVSLGSDEKFSQTFDVSLLAVDEWIDDARSGAFLPSFVLPRDPMIPMVIAGAQRYLRALADDATRGFDGYQSSDDGAEDPAAALDPQVRAIWYTLQHDFALRYINPPPTFSEHSQRLRTPSDVLNNGRGTCIDLALLLAACLEYIGLYPVVFLLTGHAFAGYWTSESSRDRFLTAKAKIDVSPVTLPGETLLMGFWFLGSLTKLASQKLVLPEAETPLPGFAWQFDKGRLKEIVEAMQAGDLVAVEATYLTNGGRWVEGCQVGAGGLDDEKEFEWMMDVALARGKRVTPLPITTDERAH